MTETSEVVGAIAAPPSWKQMASGKGVDLSRPDPAVVDFDDIAISLSLQCRFVGAMKSPDHFYSVGQHSILVMSLLPDPLKPYGLLHDAHEAYLGDDSTPKKNLFAVAFPELAKAYADLKRRWDDAIWDAAVLPRPTKEMSARIRAADHMALAIERRDLLAPPADATTERAWSWLPEPLPNVTVWPVASQHIHTTFMAQLGNWLWGDARGSA